MSARELRKFFLSIVLPSILAVTLFIISFYIIIIPSFENNLINGKREMIRELTSSAISVISDFHQQETEGNLSREDAMSGAASMVGRMRYGDDLMDYFWITDMTPVMIRHPYRSDLNGTNLSGYQDSQGKKLFVEAVNIVRMDGQGFINYIWQWKDDTTRLVSKLSYVEGFPEWNWVIGTGIYLEDVHEEIRLLEGKLLRISLIIVFIIAGSLVYIVNESLKIERRRREAEEKLKLSRQKYKTLVEASASSTLMTLEGKIIFTNQKFNNLCGRKREEIISLGFENIFDLGWDNITGLFVDAGKSVAMETYINLPDGTSTEVVISVSQVQFDSKDGYIITARKIDQGTLMERQLKKLEDELQLSLIIMNQSLGERYSEPLYCSMDDTVAFISDLMTKRNRDVIFVRSGGLIAGSVSDADLRKRILAGTGDINTAASSIMSAPVPRISLTAKIYEALDLLKKENREHLVVTDDRGAVKGYTSLSQLLALQANTMRNLVHNIENSTEVRELAEIYLGVPVMVNTLLESGAGSELLTKMIATISDSITRKVIGFSVDNLGQPPSGFSFIALGSEGRQEQTLSTDQDNAIVFESGSDLDRSHDYFQLLAKEVNTNLDRIGYRFCKGQVMAMNPKWCQPLSAWKDYFSGWINNSDPQSLLDLSIFFDFRHIYGDDEICSDLRRHIKTTVEGKAVFFYHLTHTVLKFKPPVGIFGQIIGEKESTGSASIDIKKLLLPVTGFIRIYSIFHQINETNSHRRLRLLSEGNHLPSSICDDLSFALDSLTLLRFKKQAGTIMAGHSTGNTIEMKELKDIEILGLKKTISTINELITKLKSDFRGIVD